MVPKKALSGKYPVKVLGGMQLFEAKIKAEVWPFHLLFLIASVCLGNCAERKKGTEVKRQTKGVDLITMSKK